MFGLFIALTQRSHIKTPKQPHPAHEGGNISVSINERIWYPMEHVYSCVLRVEKWSLYFKLRCLLFVDKLSTNNKLMSTSPSETWQNYIIGLLKESGGDVWSQALSQLTFIKVSDGVGYFSCPNSGVKTVVLNKQGHFSSILSAIMQTPIFSVHCDVVGKKKSEAKPVQKGVPLELPITQYQPSHEDILLHAGLNPRHSFENFAVSSCNNVAYAASQVVAGQVGKVYNPLFLWGGVGVGKTHLAQATGRRILQLNTQSRIHFCPGDKFTNEIIEAIRNRTTERFRQKYRRLDVLIVDDIQFISGKETVQQEFFHTFNDIVSRGGQVILISDRPPQQIPDIEDRLRSRFSGGLIIDISPPDFELRTAIVLIKAKERSIEIDIEAAKVIAQHSTDNRSVEGTLLSCYAKAIGHMTPTEATPPTLTQEIVYEFLHNKSRGEQNFENRLPSADRVIDVVCTYYQLKPIHLKQSNRTEHISKARHILMYILREKLGLNYDTIAHVIKRRDHTTILHGVNKIKQVAMHDQFVKNDIEAICRNLNLPT